MLSHEQIMYALHVGTSSIKKHRAATAATIATTAGCLILIAFLIIISWNVRINLLNFQAENTMLAFVDDRVPQLDAMYLQSEISSIPGISSVTFITKEDAFESYIANHAELVSQQLDASILRDRYSICIQGNVPSVDIAEAVLSIDGIAEIRVDESITDGFAIISRTINVVGLLLSILLTAISVIIMTNTIRLTTLARHDEIAVMQMMGAYDSFVRTPFLFEGCLVSIVGALLAYLIAMVSYGILCSSMDQTGIMTLICTAPMAELAAPVFVIIMSFGLGIGILGSQIAIREHIHV